MNPNGRDAKIKAVKKHIPHDFLVSTITLLSTGETLQFERNTEEMIIKSNDSFNSDNPICFKIEVE